MEKIICTYASIEQISYSQNIEAFANNESWEEVLKENPRKAIKRFKNEVGIANADWSACLGYKYKVPELKRLLKERDLPVSGRKADIIERLVDAGVQRLQDLIWGEITQGGVLLRGWPDFQTRRVTGAGIAGQPQTLEIEMSSLLRLNAGG